MPHGSRRNGLFGKLIFRSKGSDITLPVTAAGQNITARQDAVLAQSATQQSARKLTSFGEQAYEAKKTECPELITGYEALLADLAPNCPPRDSLGKIVDLKMKEVEDQKLAMSVDVKACFTKAIKTVIFAKDFIGSAVSADPHASLAWAGISVFLPLLCRPEEQNEALVDGVDQICSTMCRYTVYERVFVESGAATQNRALSDDVEQLRARLELKAVTMLGDIIEYQARVARYCSRNTMHRYFVDVVKGDDWTQISLRIEKNDAVCSKLMDALDSEKYRRYSAEMILSLESIAATQSMLLSLVEAGFQDRKVADDMRSERECLDALYKTNYESHKHAVDRRVEGTCLWFSTHPQYISWKENSSSDVLWLSADPGCGKTVISKYIVEEELATDSGPFVCYFFFRYGVPEQTSLSYAFCSMLHQFFRRYRHLIKHVLQPFMERGISITDSVESLFNILMKVASEPGVGEVVCIFDGLDECDEAVRKELIQRVTTFYTASQSTTTLDTGRVLKFLITSRPYRDIEHEFAVLADVVPAVHLSAEEETPAITLEIDLVIAHRMGQIAHKQELSHGTVQAITKHLRGEGNRTYLWLKLALENIEHALLWSDDGKEELQQIIDSIPSNIYEAYAGVLARIANNVNLDKAMDIMHLMLVARRPLSTTEMKVALALGGHMIPTGKMVFQSDERFIRNVRDVCGLFIHITEGRLYFVHKTAREFLTTTRSAEQKPMSIRGFTLPLSHAVAHLQAALVCLRTLILECSPDSDGRCAALLEFAVQYWDYHAIPASEAGFAADLCDSVFEACRCASRWPSTKRLSWPLFFAVKSFPPAALVLFFGLRKIIEARFQGAEGSHMNELNEVDVADEADLWSLRLTIAADAMYSFHGEIHHKSALGWLLAAGTQLDLYSDSRRIVIGLDEARLMFGLGASYEKSSPETQHHIRSKVRKGGYAWLQLLLDNNVVGESPMDKAQMIAATAVNGDVRMLYLLLDHGFWPSQDCSAGLVAFRGSMYAGGVMQDRYDVMVSNPQFVWATAALLVGDIQRTRSRVRFGGSDIVAMLGTGNAALALQMLGAECAYSPSSWASWCVPQILESCLSRDARLRGYSKRDGLYIVGTEKIYVGSKQFDDCHVARFEITRTLLELIDMTEMEQGTSLRVLQLAIDSDEQDMLRLVLDSVDTSETDLQGRGALSHGVWHGTAETVGILIGHGLALDDQDLRGRTPLAHAVASGNADAVRLLLAAEPDVDALIMQIRRMRPRTHEPAAGDHEVERMLSSGMWQVHKDGTRTLVQPYTYGWTGDGEKIDDVPLLALPWYE